MKSREEILKAPHFMPDLMLSTDECIFGSVLFEKWSGSCIVGMNEAGWEHVSVAPYKKHYIPTWDDMCRIKNMFWREDEEAYQIHPKKKEYVNIKDNCLHIWKPKGREMADLLK